MEGTFQALMSRSLETKEVRKASREERGPLVIEIANEGIASFNVEIDVSQCDAMTLENAKVLFGGRDDGARVPVLRVQLDAVATWWLAGGQEIKGGPSFFLGVGL